MQRWTQESYLKLKGRHWRCFNALVKLLCLHRILWLIIPQECLYNDDIAYTSGILILRAVIGSNSGSNFTLLILPVNRTDVARIPVARKAASIRGEQ